MKKILSVILTIALILTLVPAVSLATTQYGYVTGGWLRLRSGPSFNYSTIASYYTGTKVEILATSGSWYQVETPDGKTGYMYSSYITFSTPSTGTAYVTSSNGYGVRLRTGPSTVYSIIGVYPVGTAVTVLQTGTNWCKITIGSRTGYMMKKFLTTSSGGGGSSSGDTATIWSPNGYGVRLRTGPGKGYSIIGVYSVGTTVTVHSHGTTWDYITVGSRTGYMMNYYLTNYSSSTAVATSISVTPASATSAQGSMVALTTTVDGTNLSSPSYTLAVTQNASMASISGNNLVINSTAIVGSVIEVTATSVDNNSSGNKITATCQVTVTQSDAVVTSFTFDKTDATATVTASGASLDVTPTILGINLTSPYFTLAVSSNASAYVTATRVTSGHILISIGSSIPDNTVFTVTGTTLNADAGGNPLTATITVTAVKTGTLSGIELTPVSSTINQGDSTTIHVKLTYSNGSYVDNAPSSMYTLSILSGASYATLSGNTLTGASFTSTSDQTVTVKGVATDNTSLTDTCDVTVKALTTPGAPSLTVAKAETSQVKLTWSAPGDNGGSALTGYKVYVSETSTISSSPYTTTGAGDLNATVGGLTNGTTYYFWIVAVNAQGDGTPSNSLSATPNISAPDAPTGLTLDSRGDGQVTVSWTAPAYDGGSAITVYRVYYTATDYTTTSGLTQTLTGLTNGTTYTVFVKAVNSVGEGAASNSIAAVPATAPGAPGSLAVTGGVAKADLTWNAPSANGSVISGYTVEYSTTSDFSGTINTQTASSTSCEVSITDAGTWYFRVYANSDLGDGAYSDVKTASIQLPAPTVSQAEGTYTDSVSVALSCAVSGATIHYTTDGAEPTETDAAYAGALSITQNTTVKAKAFATGMTASAVTTATYTIKVGTAPGFAPVGGTYNAVQTVFLTATAGDNIYYTTNGSTPDASSALYDSVTGITVDSSMTVKAIAVRYQCEASDANSAVYTIKVATPAISDDGTNATITCATGGATILYSLNGASYATYSAPFAIVSGDTITAYATYSTWDDSDVTATYNVL